MRVGIIDLGTNSVRFDIYDFLEAKPKKAKGQIKVHVLHTEKVMVRLGQGVFTTGKLNAEAIERTLESFIGFSILIKEFHVERVVAFATSALREARDSATFIELIKKKTDIQIKVITGYEEARLIALGILAQEKTLPRGPFALVDIGGGSTEISICNGERPKTMLSLPLGTARLQQLFLKGSPPKDLWVGGRKKDPIIELRSYISSLLKAKLKGAKVKTIIGSSGTIKAISRMTPKTASIKKPQALSRESLKSTRFLKALSRDLSNKSTAELLRIKGLESRRADMILGGVILFEEICKALKSKSFSVSKHSLRDGVVVEELKLIKNGKSSVGLHLDHIQWRADRFNVKKSHVEQVQALSERLFDHLKPVHKLPSRWRDYLSAAAILHDSGEAISPMNHGQHSYYIVKAAKFPSLDDWEVEFIASLCLYHNHSWVDLRKVNWIKLRKSTGVKQEIFLKLLGILQMADSLDRSRRKLIQLTGIESTRTQIKLRLTSEYPADLEMFRFQNKKELFEQVCGKVISAILTKRKSRKN